MAAAPVEEQVEFDVILKDVIESVRVPQPVAR